MWLRDKVMTPDQAKAMYLRHLGKFETVSIRIYTGTGTSRPRFDYDGIRARPVDFSPEELVGGIIQGDRNVIVLADDVTDSGVPLPLAAGTNLKLVIRGKELTIKAINDNTRRLGGELIAYEMQVGG